LEFRVYAVFGAPRLKAELQRRQGGLCWTSAFTRCSASPPP